MSDLGHHIQIEDLPEESRQIAEIIGLPALMALSARLGGQRLYIPLSKRLAVAARNRAIRTEFTGRNLHDLAIKYGLTDRWIRAIVAGKAGLEEASDQQALYKQLKLF